MVDHSVQFKTDPKQLGLIPGAYIVIATTSAPVSSSINGVISPDNGQLLCTEELVDGDHEVSMYVPKREQVDTVTITLKGNCVEDEDPMGFI